MEKKTIREAAKQWVDGFSHVPLAVVEKLMQANPDEIHEITPPAQGNPVYIYNGDHNGEYGEVVRKSPDIADTYEIAINGDYKNPVNVSESDFEVQNDGYLPMWGTMWAFGEQLDNDWITGEFCESGLQAMADCGFRIYEQEDYEYIFGIDGAGYDFYDQHWIPLYKARGLEWHNTEE
jgi:hypothetical protein